MLELARLPMPLVAVLSILMLGGCSTLTTDKTDPPLSGAAVATAIGHVRPSKNDTCETQVQIAAQSSRIATFQTGKETVYKAAPCVAPSAAHTAAGAAPGAATSGAAKPDAAPAPARKVSVPWSLPDLEPLPPLIPPRAPVWHERTVTAAAE